MRFFRFGRTGEERPGALDGEGVRRDISALVNDLVGDALNPASLAQIAATDLRQCPEVPEKERIGACVGQVGNFIGVGMNYADHILEIGAETPTKPVLFNKAPSCIVGPNDDIVIPRGSQKTDWEAELAVVIGARALALDENEVGAVIAGYCVCNDISERGFQFTTGTPAGVALGMKEPRYLKAGAVELGVEGLAAQRVRLVSA